MDESRIISSTYFLGRPNPLPIVFPIVVDEVNIFTNSSFLKFFISIPSVGGGT